MSDEEKENEAERPTDEEMEAQLEEMFNMVDDILKALAHAGFIDKDEDGLTMDSLAGIIAKQRQAAFIMTPVTWVDYFGLHTGEVGLWKN